MKYLYLFTLKEFPNCIKVGETEEKFNITTKGDCVVVARNGDKVCLSARRQAWEKWAEENKYTINRWEPLGEKPYGDEALHKYLKARGYKKVTIPVNNATPAVRKSCFSEEFFMAKDEKAELTKKELDDFINAIYDFDKIIQALP